MALTTIQRTHIIVSYGDYDTLAELAFHVNCEIPDLKEFLIEKNILTEKEIIKKPIKKHPKRHKSKRIIDKVENIEPITLHGFENNYHPKSKDLEPKFSAREVQMLEDSMIEESELQLWSSLQTINGKQCVVYQSIMNY